MTETVQPAMFQFVMHRGYMVGDELEHPGMITRVRGDAPPAQTWVNLEVWPADLREPFRAIAGWYPTRESAIASGDRSSCWPCPQNSPVTG